ncbi:MULTISPECIES: PACE efflux transporter [Shewanella]|uniref:PACE efflux transporter n=1 Tax=Shewanella electrodiphila TaxID=934143 RepID=A0ABT0KIR5_9GAMM|nr:PACE efflux transporter [Shewanella electrodiphila]MCL1043731.1 PACE efflux transporter [Shewanella electrodiphila]
MSTVERIFHAVLFEFLAIIGSVIGLMIFTDYALASLSGTMIAIATIAMGWNFIFNIIFDKFYTEPREQRTVIQRMIYIGFFEAGLLMLTIPVMAYILGISLIEAFWLDISVTVFITVYAYVYNYAYDHIRARVMLNRNTVALDTQ